jgi:hypothetical protein
MMKKKKKVINMIRLIVADADMEMGDDSEREFDEYAEELQTSMDGDI